MKILHLLSNVKLTGPAEPAINLCASLKQTGLDVQFACCTSSGQKTQTVLHRAHVRGLAPITQLKLTRHFNLIYDLQDVFKLSQFIESEGIDIVHTHLQNDHLVGGFAAKKSRRAVRVVRSCYDSDGLSGSIRNRYMLDHFTDALIVASQGVKAKVTEKLGFPEDKMWVVEGAVDLQRFDPTKQWPNFREKFGLSPSDFVVGIVARIQPHRRFPMLLEAMKTVSRVNSDIKLLIVGRGSRMSWVAVEPVKRMGLEHCIKFAGYHRGDDYVATLACFDAKIFLVPGTDGTCRAVREAMAMGKPVIAANRGMLPEIIDHGVNGLIIEDKPPHIAEAILYLAQDLERTRQMGFEAMRKAQQTYSLELQANSVARIYNDVIRD